MENSSSNDNNNSGNQNDSNSSNYNDYNNINSNDKYRSNCNNNVCDKENDNSNNDNSYNNDNSNNKNNNDVNDGSLPTLLPALAILTAHSAAETPSMSPMGPMHMVAATALPVSLQTSMAHSISSMCSKY